jgi:D-glycero-alpha-D-manno-heptose-7-phosphate kinase
MTTKDQLAREAIYIEQEMCKDNVGCQDQTLAAYGGFNYIEFGGPHHLRVRTVTILPEKVKMLQGHMMMFFTGFARMASQIAAHQIKNIPKKKTELREMYQMVRHAVEILNGNDLLAFGKLLDESWQIKRTLSDKISTPHIDQMYDIARRAGALGGKLLGAGGGGFVLIFAPPEKQKRIRERLKKFLEIPFKFENQGSQIIFYQPNAGDVS